MDTGHVGQFLLVCPLVVSGVLQEWHAGGVTNVIHALLCAR